MRISASLGLDAEGQVHRAEAALGRQPGRLCVRAVRAGVSATSAASPASIVSRSSPPQVCGVLTHTVPTAAYRGAGRPEATYAIERLIDVAARELGISPYELRRRNLIPPDGDAVQDRADLHLRLRRVRRQHAGGGRAGRVRSTFEQRRSEAANARQAARHRAVQLHRGRRRAVPAAGQGSCDAAPGRGRHAGPALGVDVGGAGAGDDDDPTGRRPVRRADRAGDLGGRRHRPAAERQGQWRIGRAVHRRIGGDAGGGQGDREGAPDRRRTAGGRRGGRRIRRTGGSPSPAPTGRSTLATLPRAAHDPRTSRRARKAGWSKAANSRRPR